uniref:Uncharacterized protein n=1 Tax=Avena sativa TaxID=4498 RepID=A0ACD5UFZ2_AVESA
MKRHRHADRLSALPDKALECILSSLASDEATRTSVLSRRWRRVCAAVPVVDLADPKEGNRDTSSEKLLPVCFNQKVTGAILGKAPGTPLRTLRLDAFHPPHDLLDQWILTATCSGAEDIDVKLRYWHDNERSPCPFGLSKEASEDLDGNETSSYVKTQHRLFRCRTLRRLRLTNWTLDLPQGVVVSSLETLCLSRIVDANGLLPQLLSNCPRLADLTLQECPSVKDISVESPHLRSFTMICCHHANRIKLHSSCLRSLPYKGSLPTDTLFEVENYQGVAALTIEICEDLSNRESTEVAPVTALITRFTKLTYLDLSLRPSMAYHCGLFADAVRTLPLRQLDLQGCFLNDHAVRSIAVLLRDTQNLEVFSLFLLDPKPQEKRSFCISDDESDTEPKDDYSGDRVHHSSRLTSSLRQMYIRCLGHKLRRVNIVNYTGQKLERILAHFLISRGNTLEKFSVTSEVGSSRQKDQMAWELRSWRSNRHTRVTVN